MSVVWRCFGSVSVTQLWPRFLLKSELGVGVGSKKRDRGCCGEILVVGLQDWANMDASRVSYACLKVLVLIRPSSVTILLNCSLSHSLTGNTHRNTKQTPLSELRVSYLSICPKPQSSTESVSIKPTIWAAERILCASTVRNSIHTE